MQFCDEVPRRFFTCYSADGGYSMREAMSSAALQPVTEVELLRQLQSSRAFRVQNTGSVPIPSTIYHIWNSMQLMSCPSQWQLQLSERLAWHGGQIRAVEEEDSMKQWAAATDYH